MASTISSSRTLKYTTTPDGILVPSSPSSSSYHYVPYSKRAQTLSLTNPEPPQPLPPTESKLDYQDFLNQQGEHALQSTRLYRYPPPDPSNPFLPLSELRLRCVTLDESPIAPSESASTSDFSSPPSLPVAPPPSRRRRHRSHHFPFMYSTASTPRSPTVPLSSSMDPLSCVTSPSQYSLVLAQTPRSPTFHFEYPEPWHDPKFGLPQRGSSDEGHGGGIWYRKKLGKWPPEEFGDGGDPFAADSALAAKESKEDENTNEGEEEGRDKPALAGETEGGERSSSPSKPSQIRPLPHPSSISAILSTSVKGRSDSLISKASTMHPKSPIHTKVRSDSILSKPKSDTASIMSRDQSRMMASSPTPSSFSHSSSSSSHPKFSGLLKALNLSAGVNGHHASASTATIASPLGPSRLRITHPHLIDRPSSPVTSLSTLTSTTAPRPLSPDRETTSESEPSLKTPPRDSPLALLPPEGTLKAVLQTVQIPFPVVHEDEEDDEEAMATSPAPLSAAITVSEGGGPDADAVSISSSAGGQGSRTPYRQSVRNVTPPPMPTPPPVPSLPLPIVSSLPATTVQSVPPIQPSPAPSPPATTAPTPPPIVQLLRSSAANGARRAPSSIILLDEPPSKGSNNKAAKDKGDTDSLLRKKGNKLMKRPRSLANPLGTKGGFHRHSSSLDTNHFSSPFRSSSYREELKFSESAPVTDSQLIRASALEILSTEQDEDGEFKKVKFGKIFEEKKTVVCFIRHFWCPLCQDYILSIMEQITDPSILDRSDVQLVIIGCGSPAMAKSYKENIFHFPFALYTDPTLQLYTALGMTLKSVDPGPEEERGEYVKHGTMSGTALVLKRAFMNGGGVGRAGDVKQLGGEFVLGPGLQATFTHRMTTTRSHTPIRTLLLHAGVDLNPIPPNMRHFLSFEEEDKWMGEREKDWIDVLRRRRERRMWWGGNEGIEEEDEKESSAGCTVEGGVCVVPERIQVGGGVGEIGVF